MLKSERRPVRTALSQVFWYSVQIAIVAFWVYVEWDISQTTGRPARPVFALFLGIGMAITFTVVCALIRELFLSLLRRLRGVKLSDVSEASHSISGPLATSGHLSKPHEILPGPRFRKEPR